MDRLFIFLKGEVKIEIKTGNQLCELGVFQKADISGKLPFSRMQS